MPGQEEWKREARDAKLGEGSSVRGPNRLVKVVGMSRPLESALRGFVTLERCLVGLMPYEMQRALGLQLGDLRGGCRIYRFKRLPMIGEYSNELTAEFPDGVVFSDASYREERVQLRTDRHVEAQTGVKSDREPKGFYRAGDPTIPQWKLTESIPVDGPPFPLATRVPYPYRP